MMAQSSAHSYMCTRDTRELLSMDRSTSGAGTILDAQRGISHNRSKSEASSRQSWPMRDYTQACTMHACIPILQRPNNYAFHKCMRHELTGSSTLSCTYTSLLATSTSTGAYSSSRATEGRWVGGRAVQDASRSAIVCRAINAPVATMVRGCFQECQVFAFVTFLCLHLDLFSIYKNTPYIPTCGLMASASSSFVRKGKARVLPRGTRPSTQQGQLLVSSGVPSLDYLLGFGIRL